MPDHKDQPPWMIPGVSAAVSLFRGPGGFCHSCCQAEPHYLIQGMAHDATSAVPDDLVPIHLCRRCAVVIATRLLELEIG